MQMAASGWTMNLVEPFTEVYTGQGDNLSYVIDLNLKRRHLNESQRGMVAARLANLENGVRADRSSANLRSLAPVSQGYAATLLNTSERTVNSAKKVIKNGVSEVVKAVENGKLSVSVAERLEGVLRGK
jgi:hypothetical protein